MKLVLAGRRIILPGHFSAVTFLPNPMPVITSIPVRLFRQDDFGRVAFEVDGDAFRIHESLGKAIHESLHRTALYQILGERSVKGRSKLLTSQDSRTRPDSVSLPPDSVSPPQIPRWLVTRARPFAS